ARDPPSLYTPFRIAPDDEVFHILALDTGAWPGVGGFTYAPRFATPEDLPPIRGLLTDVYGGLDERWFATLPSAEERCFLVEVDGTLAGVAWATLAGAHGRLHSLSVRPAYRRLGIGTDLWAARVLWLRAAGARRVISEVGERNLPSQAVAARGGMRRVGRMFRHDRALADPA
ncbi:MAG TPA: GNAT family N-acetyltransferase, partial [Thermoplasmata archaeon]|nr:GNAT family N-acetyltransferase [Thermoplasmata archaeon]